MRKLTNWLDYYVSSYTTNTESPEEYHLWNAISIIGATLGRKCYVKRGFFTTYPNFYILVVGTSAKFKKSTASSIALNIYNNTFPELAVHSKKITLEKLILNLSAKTGEESSESIVFTDELSNFIGRDAKKHGVIDFLTEVYLCPEKWNNETKTKGCDYLENVFLTFIGCTTPEDLTKFSDTMIDGGLAGRVLFVVSETPRDPQAWFDEHHLKKMRECEEDLIHDLRMIHEISGEYVFTDEAKNKYIELYNKNHARDDFPYRLNNYKNRKGEHINKLAMVVAASKRDSTVIELEDILQVDAILTNLEVLMPLAFEGSPISQESSQQDKILRQIVNKGGEITHSELLRLNSRYMNAKTFQEIIETLEDSNHIEVKLAGQRAKKVYRYVG